MAHPATRSGIALVQRNADRGLPEISFEEAKRCNLLRATPDGNCAYHTFALFFNKRNASEVEVQQCKIHIGQQLLRWVLGADLDGMVDDMELDHIQIAKLMKFDLFESFADGRIVWAKDASRKQRLAISKTIGWARRNVQDRVAREWFAIPWLAVAATTLNCNIAVWEPVEGGRLRLYENGHEVGLFIEDERENRFMHMVYSSNAGGGGLFRTT